MNLAIDQEKPKSCIQVVFVTSVFGAVHNGPALYANYLWEYFNADPEIDFYLVTPSSDIKHEKIYESGTFGNSRQNYQMLQLKALEVANQLADEGVIIHGNNSHAMSLLKDHTGPLIGQVNDYDAARVMQNPLLIIRRHGIRRFLSLYYRNRKEQDFFRIANLLVCNSKFVRNELIHRYQLSSDTARKVIYKAIDFQAFPHVRSSMKSKKNLLFVGSNWFGKGLDIAIKSLASLPSKFDYLKLEVVGQCSANELKIKNLVHRLKLENRVVFHGHIARPRIPGFFHNAAALVFPSHNEALGVTAIESVASGTPVIASAIGGIPEIFSGTQSSILVSNQSSSFSLAIQALLENYPSDSKIMHDRSLIEKKFCLEDMLKKIKLVYKSPLSKIGKNG
ncbi:glycosyltransferase family 4 protein [Mariniblastus sp.]|nr:glycosyltransferase family 4 protein [Mariniblastus sp.]